MRSLLHQAWRAVGCLAALGCAASCVQAQTYAFDTSDSPFIAGHRNMGWYSGPTDSHSPTNDNYVAGIAWDGKAYESYRDFFSFDLSGLSLAGRTVTGASLTLTRFFTLGTGQALGLFDVTTPAATLKDTSGASAAIFADLGSGTSYGTFAVPDSSSPDDLLTLSLNPAALADIAGHAGGFFSIGGALENPAGNPYLFGSSPQVGSGIQRLTVSLGPAAVPEPSPALLAGIGTLAAGALRARRVLRRQRANR